MSEGYSAAAPPGFANRLIELYSRYTTETSQWCVAGRYVWRESGWFFRRRLSAEFSSTRTRLEHAFGPDSRDSDTASIRLLGRF